jgi:hypothetical protein
MIKKNRYVTLNAILSFDYELHEKIIWNSLIVDFIYNQLRNKQCTLFELAPTTHSIIYEFKETYSEVKVNSKKCLYASGVTLAIDMLKNIVSESDFYLGNMLIVNAKISNDSVKEIVNLWDKNIAETELEIFKMDCDGLSFNWHNPTDENAEEKFNQVFTVYK